MKSFKQFLSENVNISGDFTGNLYINSTQQEPQQVGEEYIADVVWNGSLYRIEMVTKTGIPSKQELGEQIQGEYPGAIVHNIYPSQVNTSRIKSSQRYQPERLTWTD
jgi:hypothetical protein